MSIFRKLFGSNETSSRSSNPDEHVLKLLLQLTIRDWHDVSLAAVPFHADISSTELDILATNVDSSVVIGIIKSRLLPYRKLEWFRLYEAKEFDFCRNYGTAKIGCLEVNYEKSIGDPQDGGMYIVTPEWVYILRTGKGEFMCLRRWTSTSWR